MVGLPKSRPPRVHRYPEPSVYNHSEESFGWAVSYADVLMVLLCFFTVFFSMDQKETNSILQKIIGMEGVGAGSGSGVDSNSALREISSISSPTKQALSAELTTIDSGLIVSVQQLADGEGVVLMLPNDSYAPGQFTLRPAAKVLLVSTLKKLKKYESEIELTFVGFTDAEAVRQKRSASIQTNFDLSALRATHALQEAFALQFPPDRLKAKGMGHVGRQSRTLSIQINLKRAT
ncbi:hypothetical protein BH10BDE1_BH10BDE1_02750 [soil metagenome]